jgi:DeoR/GlpR family transcriptional regulator of sugar metabolism
MDDLSTSDARSTLKSWAASDLQAGMTVGVAGAGASRLVWSAVADIPGVNLVTNSLLAWNQTASDGRRDAANRSHHLLAGQVSATGVVSGMLAIASLELFRFDVVLLCGGAHASDIGFSTSTLGEAEVDRAFVECSSKAVVVTSADDTTFGFPALVCGPDYFSDVIQLSATGRQGDIV